MQEFYQNLGHKITQQRSKTKATQTIHKFTSTSPPKSPLTLELGNKQNRKTKQIQKKDRNRHGAANEEEEKATKSKHEG